MGALAESTARLRDEIVAGRQARVAFRNQLVKETRARQVRVSGLLAAFAGDLAGARRAWLGPAPAEARAAERRIEPKRAEAAPAGSRPAVEASPPAAPLRFHPNRPHPKKHPKR